MLAMSALVACAAPPGTTGGGGEGIAGWLARVGKTDLPPVVESTGSGEELAFVKSVLTDLQRLSFAENREYCGYLGVDRAGRYATTLISEGAESSCPLPVVPPGLSLVASFHTHGAYSPDYASEWPTAQDMETDRSYGVDGYISTPGGRLWHVDTDTMTATEVCGRRCLPQDRRYVASEDGPLLPVLTYGQIAAWESF